MLRITCAATVLLLCASDVRAQYQTRFDVDAGWTFTSNHPTFGWDVDDDPADRFHSPLASLNVQYAEGHWVSATATSPAIDISGMTHPELSFWTWADVTYWRPEASWTILASTACFGCTASGGLASTLPSRRRRADR